MITFSDLDKAAQKLNGHAHVVIHPDGELTIVELDEEEHPRLEATEIAAGSNMTTYTITSKVIPWIPLAALIRSTRSSPEYLLCSGQEGENSSKIILSNHVAL